MGIYGQILIIILPSLIVFLTAYYSIKLFISREIEKKELDIKATYKKDIVMIRLQAYERLLLLFERISPDNLVMRLDKTEVPAKQFHLDLLTSIRAEFDHNISQQLYISEEVWQVLIEAKEEIIKVINFAKDEVQDDDNATMLSRKILEINLKHNSPSLKALTYLKVEARSLF